MSKYEKQRLQRIAENKAKLEALGYSLFFESPNSKYQEQ